LGDVTLVTTETEGKGKKRCGKNREAFRPISRIYFLLFLAYNGAIRFFRTTPHETGGRLRPW